MMIYDITRTVRPTTKVWPGDTPFSFRHVLRLEDGASVNLTTMTMSPHTGTHADAYYHYKPDGAHPVMMPLKAYIGAATVISSPKEDGPLYPDDFFHYDLRSAKRVLIRSQVSDLEDDQWPEVFPYLSVELIEWLAGLGVVLIGLDSPSVDAFDSKDLPCHHALAKHGLVNLELLQLRDVPNGDDYELIALPLKLDMVCGAPVRAILRKNDP